MCDGKDAFHRVPLLLPREVRDAVESVLTTNETRFTFSHARGRLLAMTAGNGALPGVGRETPAAGAHVFNGHTNIFFVTVNAKDRVPWMNQPAVQSSLIGIWRDQAAAWRVGYHLLMPDHMKNPDDWPFHGRVHDIQWIGD